jgi:hypothetical protein
MSCLDGAFDHLETQFANLTSIAWSTSGLSHFAMALIGQLPVPSPRALASFEDVDAFPEHGVEIPLAGGPLDHAAKRPAASRAAPRQAARSDAGMALASRHPSAMAAATRCQSLGIPTMVSLPGATALAAPHSMTADFPIRP